MRTKKIVLANPPVWVYNSPPINIAYLASYAKKQGYAVKSFDFNIELLNMADSKQKEYWKPDYIGYWNNREKWETIIKPALGNKMMDYMLKKILAEKPDLVGFTINYSPHLINDLAGKIKEKSPHTIIIAGGNLAGKEFCGRTLLDGNVDLCILGEGEETLIKILEAMNKNIGFERLKGISYKKGEEIIENPMRERIIKIDELPYPDFSDFDISSYKDFDMRTPSIRIPLLFSRGCICSCDFCLQGAIWGKPFVCRSGKNLFDEVMYDIKKYRASKFQFSDLEINGDLRKLEDFCDLLISNNIKIGWGGGTLIRKGMDMGLLKKMKAAGCEWLDIGLESGSNKVIKAMGKHFTSKEAKEFFKNIHEAGITISISLIVGHPEEKIEDFNETLKLLKESAPYLGNITPSCSICLILPNTELNKKVITYGGDPQKDRWVEWNLNGLDFNERKRRVKILNEFIKDNLGSKGIKIPDEEVFHYTK